MGVAEIRWRSMDWIGLAQDRTQCTAFMNAVMNVPYNAWKFLSSCTICGFFSSAQLHIVSVM
jgi:hypothetical protein